MVILFLFIQFHMLGVKASLFGNSLLFRLDLQNKQQLVHQFLLLILII